MEVFEETISQKTSDVSEREDPRSYRVLFCLFFPRPVYREGAVEATFSDNLVGSKAEPKQC